ncbi:putative PWWP domain-containing protein [Helianthus annuus]|nr:putative PWWP domain-containing protein [Helianthus annuus]
MGSSCEANGQNIDSTVGGLVWVRRRNGSWWPGRILGPDELPESGLVSPKRAGTPVKLLGREDASVDWYNLEKSKRVKAFRCGEYDECIEKAKFTANYSCKKAAKYARREDAILQALEIENSQFLKNSNSETISHTDKTKNISDKLSGLEFISVSPQELSRTAASADDNSEDDGSKKRMRGLHDLGVGTFKKKRTGVAHIHDYLKKKNRRCQLTTVLKKTEMVSIPVICEEHNGSEYNNNNELKGSFSDSTGDVTNNINSSGFKQKEDENYSVLELLETDDSSGRLFDVPFVREQKQTAGSSPASIPETEFQESGSIISSGADDIISHIIDNNGSSKWQHKGKRKSRNKIKTKTLQNFLTESTEEVNNTVEVKGSQRFMFIHQSCYKRTGSLYDVRIDVESRNFRRHLPYISLWSNFTGQRVTGHSLEVEVVTDDGWLNSSECLSSSCGEAPKKARKNGGVTSNKKIRKLSSLREKGVLKRPDIGCVPLKVVFGRINAVLGIN